MDPVESIIKDASGNGRDGTVQQASAIEDGVGGRAMRFAKTGGSRVVLPSSACVAGANPRTIAFWFRTATGVDNWQFAFGFGEDSSNCNGGGSFNCRFRSDGTLGFMGCGADYDGDAGNGIRVDDGLWHHVAYTFGDGKVTTYTDGQYNWVYSNGGLSTKCEAAYISSPNGRDYASYNAGGDIDEFRIFDRALSNDEIRQLMEFDLALGEAPGR